MTRRARTSATASRCARRRRRRSSGASPRSARLLGLEDLLDRRPAALSGGQRQRVAMGRAIVREPAAFLMDEPLSNLDAKLRVGMRAELARLHERLGVTTVYVTHDQVEAMTLGQRVAVMRDGADPAGRHAAGALPRAGQPLRRRVHRLAVDEPRRGPTSGERRRRVRRLADPARREAAAGEGRVARSSASGRRTSRTPRTPRAACREIDVEVAGRRGARRGDARDLPRRRPAGRGRRSAGGARRGRARRTLLADDARALFTARVDARTSARAGRHAVGSPSTRRAFHFFDAETGVSLAAAAEERELQTA